uniref:Uncharacterized protein n=1 Tax=Palpitomonas bilix TaxID=652834 RepID=A0A7S3G419_9EUKA
MTFVYKVSYSLYFALVLIRTCTSHMHNIAALNRTPSALPHIQHYPPHPRPPRLLIPSFPPPPLHHVASPFFATYTSTRYMRASAHDSEGSAGVCRGGMGWVVLSTFLTTTLPHASRMSQLG